MSTNDMTAQILGVLILIVLPVALGLLVGLLLLRSVACAEFTETVVLWSMLAVPYAIALGLGVDLWRGMSNWESGGAPLPLAGTVILPLVFVGQAVIRFRKLKKEEMAEQSGSKDVW